MAQTTRVIFNGKRKSRGAGEKDDPTGTEAKEDEGSTDENGSRGVCVSGSRTPVKVFNQTD